MPSYLDTIYSLGTAVFSHHRLGEASGLAAADSVGGHTGTYQASGVTLGQPGALTGDINTSVLLDGAAGYVTLPTLTADFTTNGFGFIVWCKPSSSPANARLVDLAGAGGGGNLNLLFYRSGTGSAVSFDVFDSGGHAVFTSSTGALVNGAWQMLAAGVDASGHATIWRNGSVLNTRTGMALPVSGTRTLNFLGKSNFGGDPLWGGGLDEITILTRKPTDAEIAALWGASQTGGSAFPYFLPQVAWNPTYDSSPPLTKWTQPHADLTEANGFEDLQIHCRAGHPDIPDDYCQVILRDPTGTFDPYNPASPLQPSLNTLRRPMRVLSVQSGVTRCVFYGLTDELKPDDPKTAGARMMTIRAVSPLMARITDADNAGGIFVRGSVNPVPFDHTGANQSIVPLLFQGLNQNLVDDLTLLAEPSTDTAGSALIGGKTYQVGSLLRRIAELSQGRYYCRPLYAVSAGQLDYEMVWEPKDYPKTASALYTVVAANRDVEGPTQRAYSLRGLAA